MNTGLCGINVLVHILRCRLRHAVASSPSEGIKLSAVLQSFLGMRGDRGSMSIRSSKRLEQ